MKPPRGSFRLRIGRRSEAGATYFITTTTCDRNPVLTSNGAAECIVRAIDWREKQEIWTWLCYVIMPDHLHLVLTLNVQKHLSSTIHSFKRHAGSELCRRLSCQSPVWQSGYFDHRLRSFEKMEQVAFYCFRNSVHAGLSRDGDDWPWFGCRADLWARVLARREELLALEAERKAWSAPIGSEP